VRGGLVGEKRLSKEKKTAERPPDSR